MSDELILVQNLIYEIRGQKIMLDFDLARLYQVKTGELNQSVKRNIKRFPPDFMFQLTPEEVKMMSQIVISSKRKASAPPFAFTEQGVAMLSGLLKSDVAIAANIAIMRAFVQVMSILASVGALFVVRKWLEQFAEKVALSPIYFICGSVLVLLIVLGVVVLNCLRIARANPVESLKNE